MQTRALKVWLLAVLLPALSGCLRHTRKVQQAQLAGPVLNANAVQLVDAVNQRYSEIQSLSATVEFTASTGGERQGKQTDYTSFRGYILMRKPQMLRVLGLVPVLHTRAFDLASDGSRFKLLIPPKGRAIEGSNRLTKRSNNPLENLRPDLFTDSVLIQSIGADRLVYLTADSTQSLNAKTKQLTETPEYDLHVIEDHVYTAGQAPVRVGEPARIIRFNRLDLMPLEQDIYDPDGDVATKVTYGKYQTFGTTRFPATITIERPLESYRIVIAIQKLTVNQALADDQFQLKIPEGVQVEQLP